MVKGITYKLPISNTGAFAFTSGVSRMEAAIDFVISYWDVVREYKDFFSTLFLRAFLQTPSNENISVLRPLIAERLATLFQNTVSEIDVEGASMKRNTSRKEYEISLVYKFTGQAESRAEKEKLILTRFL